MAAVLTAVWLVRALLLAIKCQFFFIDPTSRGILTGNTSRIEAQPSFNELIITRNELLGSTERASQEQINTILNSSSKWASKSPPAVNRPDLHDTIGTTSRANPIHALSHQLT
jgi:hypothetical protein